MPATPDAIAERLQGTPGASGFDGIRAKCLGDSIFELLQGASEDLAARLELRPQSKKAEAVVAGGGAAPDAAPPKHREPPPRHPAGGGWAGTAPPPPAACPPGPPPPPRA